MSKDKSFEELLSELEVIVGELNNSELPLETAIAKYKAGMALSAECNQKLTEAEVAITQIVAADGTTKDFED
jgi:exodeoxyribonuclease VII small subunit